jgi:hypothetical protein
MSEQHVERKPGRMRDAAAVRGEGQLTAVDERDGGSQRRSIQQQRAGEGSGAD